MAASTEDNPFNDLAKDADLCHPKEKIPAVFKELEKTHPKPGFRDANIPLELAQVYRSWIRDLLRTPNGNLTIRQAADMYPTVEALMTNQGLTKAQAQTLLYLAGRLSKAFERYHPGFLNMLETTYLDDAKFYRDAELRLVIYVLFELAAPKLLLGKSGKVAAAT